MCVYILPGTTIISDCWGSSICLGNEGSRTTPSNAASVLWIYARVLTQIGLRPRGSMPSSPQALLINEVKFVINILKGSPSAAFNDVAELIVKRCVRFIIIPLVHICHLSFPTGHFRDVLNIGKMQPRVKKGD